ncbi:MAG: AraC family transcriptional regulator [Bacteroidetes bacterium]|nr:AraC family transcriptional regulator [Bacteroidota bacterium]
MGLQSELSGNSITRVSNIRRNSAGHWAEKGKEIIDNSYADLSGIDEVCSTLGISAAHFREVFYFAYHITPKRYLDTVRVEQAKKLLCRKGASGKLPTIEQVAGLIDFTGVSTFVRRFKEIARYSPTEFRKMCHVTVSTCENVLRKRRIRLDKKKPLV